MSYKIQGFQGFTLKSFQGFQATTNGSKLTYLRVNKLHMIELNELAQVAESINEFHTPTEVNATLLEIYVNLQTSAEFQQKSNEEKHDIGLLLINLARLNKICNVKKE